MRYLFLLLVVSGCSHYNSMLPHYNVGKRHPQKIQFSSCTNYIVGFSTNEDGMSYANALDHAGVSPDQVFSVDERRWLWTWPFYYWRCLDINTNDSYIYKQVTTQAPEALTSQKETLLVPVKETDTKNTEPGSISGNLKYDLSLCDKLEKKEASSCRKIINRQYESLQKVK